MWSEEAPQPRGGRRGSSIYKKDGGHEESCAPQVTAAGPHLTSILRRRAEVCGPSVPPAPAPAPVTGMARVLCGQFLASLRDLLQVTSAYALGESRLVYFCGNWEMYRQSKLVQRGNAADLLSESGLFYAISPNFFALRCSSLPSLSRCCRLLSLRA